VDLVVVLRSETQVLQLQQVQEQQVREMLVA
jgi:hypothetical protein